MDADKVLALAIEAGFSHACWTDKGMKHWRGTRTDLNRFADLIEQAKEKQMIAEGWRSPEQVVCKHEPYQGFCVHCNIPFVDGEPSKERK